jgi:hypothetical protein
MAYNGKGQGGSVINAETVHVQTYNWTVGEFSADCSREGQTTRTVGCAGSNGKTDYDAAFCTAFAGSAEPDASEACTGPATMFKSGDKCLHYSVRQGFLEMADCTGAATQRFTLTGDGLLKSSKDGKCVATVDGAVKVETCSAGLDTQSWYVDDGKIVSAAGDSSCLEVDPASMVNVLLGECGSVDTQTFEAAEPVFHAKKYGSFAFQNQCLQYEEYYTTKLDQGQCSYLMKNPEPNPAQTWTLTMADELRSDSNDECLETTGLLDGEWDDEWTPGLIRKLKASSGRVTADNCEGEFVGEWEDKFTPGVLHKMCQDKNKLSMNTGASGTWRIVKYSPEECYTDYCNKYADLKNAFCGGRECNYHVHWHTCKTHWETHGKNENRFDPQICLDAIGDLSMNFGGTVVKAFLVGDETGTIRTLEWNNLNSWTKKAGSEAAASGGTISGTELTWNFWTGAMTASLSGDKLYWPNGNVWTRKAPNLKLVPCGGWLSQKWTIDGDNLRSQAFSDTCVALTPRGWAGGVCGDYTSRFTFGNQPSWVTEG